MFFSFFRQCTDKQVFKDLDFLGWYTTGNRPTDQDIKVHKQICEINECPIMLQLSPQSRNFDVRYILSFHNFFSTFFFNIFFCFSSTSNRFVVQFLLIATPSEDL